MHRSVRVAVSVRSAALAVMLPYAHAGAQQPAVGCGMPGMHAWQSTRPSPLDSATLTIGNRTAVFCYSRPNARGRSVDSLLPLGRAWRTGANEPTTLTISDRLSVGGAELSPGRYVILTVPQTTEWRVVFSTTAETEPAKMFATLHQVTIGAARVERTAVPVEQFTIRALTDSLDPAFTLDWGTRRVRLPVRAIP